MKTFYDIMSIVWMILTVISGSYFLFTNSVTDTHVIEAGVFLILGNLSLILARLERD